MNNSNNQNFDFRGDRKIRSVDGIFVPRNPAPKASPQVNQQPIKPQPPAPPPVQLVKKPLAINNLPKKISSPKQPEPSRVITFQPPTKQNIDQNFFDMPLAQESENDSHEKTSYYKRFVIVGMSLVLLIGLIFSGNFLLKNENSIQTKVLAESKEGEKLLASAQESLANFDFTKAGEDFDKAQENFAKVESELSAYGQNSIYISKIPKNKSQVTSGAQVISVARDISLAGSQLCAIEKDLQGISLLDQKEIDNWFPFAQVTKRLEKAKDAFAKAQVKLSKINPTGISEVDGTVSQFKNKLPELQKTLELALETSKSLPSILGKDKKTDFLILFQNPAEARATGGFLGNYGSLSFSKGKMIGPSVFDIYKLKWMDWGKDSIVKPPQEVYDADLSLWQKGRWEIWDANWYIDYPTSAKGIQLLYEKTTQEISDGVIAIDPTVFSEILKVIGPIKLSKYGVTANSKNFWSMMERKVEVDNAFKKGKASYGEANPKQILKDFAPLFMAKIKKANAKTKNQIFKTIIKAIQEKHILLYANDPGLEDLLSYLNVNGQIKNASQDFLYFNESNVGVNKSSNRITQNAELNVKIEGNQIKNQLVLTRKHNGSPKNQIEGRNISYFRFLVPYGTKLNSMTIDGKDVASKVILGEENGKTKFGIKLGLKPQEGQQIVLEYTLPFTVNPTSLTPYNYSLYVQKQPGRIKDGLEVNLELPSGISAANISGPVSTTKDQNKINFKTNLLQDRAFNILLKK